MFVQLKKQRNSATVYRLHHCLLLLLLVLGQQHVTAQPHGRRTFAQRSLLRPVRHSAHKQTPPGALTPDDAMVPMEVLRTHTNNREEDTVCIRFLHDTMYTEWMSCCRTTRRKCIRRWKYHRLHRRRHRRMSCNRSRMLFQLRKLGWWNSRLSPCCWIRYAPFWWVLWRPHE